MTQEAKDLFSHSVKFNNVWAILASAVMVTASTVYTTTTYINRMETRMALQEQKIDYLVKLLESEDEYYKEIGLKIADHEKRITIIETQHKGVE